MRTRPTGISIIGLFLLVAPVILVVSAISLLVPGTFLDQIWVVNETGYRQMLPFRGLVGIGFLALGVVIALAGIGLLKGRKWGWWLAVLIVMSVRFSCRKAIGVGGLLRCTNRTLTQRG